METTTYPVLLSYSRPGMKNTCLTAKLTTHTPYSQLLQVVAREFGVPETDIMLSYHTLHNVYLPLHAHNFGSFKKTMTFNKLIRVQRLDPLASNTLIPVVTKQNTPIRDVKLTELKPIPRYQLDPESTCSFLGDRLLHLRPFLESMGIRSNDKINASQQTQQSTGRPQSVKNHH